MPTRKTNLGARLRVELNDPDAQFRLTNVKRTDPMSVRVLAVIETVMITTAVSAESLSDRDFERAARDFRIQTYHQFRTKRSEYDARIAKG